MCRDGHCILLSYLSALKEKEKEKKFKHRSGFPVWRHIMLGGSQARPLRDQHAEVADGPVLSRSEDQCCGLLSVSEYGVVGPGLEWTTIPHLPLESEEDQNASRES